MTSDTFIEAAQAPLTMPRMEISFGNRLRELRKKAGLTQQQVASALQISHPAVQQWEAGRTHPSMENLMALAGVVGPEILGWSRQPIDTAPAPQSGYRVEPNAIFEGPATLPLRNGPRDIEERGITVGGFGDDESAFELNGQVIDMVIRPPGIANRQGVFALRVANESMFPRFEDGDRVYVEPRKAAIGEYVVIELYPTREDGAGKSFIKRLVSQNSGRVTVEQFNPKGRLEFARDEIKQILRVIPMSELLGI